MRTMNHKDAKALRKPSLWEKRIGELVDGRKVFVPQKKEEERILALTRRASNQARSLPKMGEGEEARSAGAIYIIAEESN
jgi:hypothetical protein